MDCGGAVDQRVDEREADRVRFGARVDLPGDAWLGLGELLVGVPPELAGGGVEAQPAGVTGSAALS